MRLIGLLVVGLTLCAGVTFGQGRESVETGLVVARADDGFWARFAHPVRQGARVQIRAFREGETVGTGSITWASPIPPYEALLTDIRQSASIRRVSIVTPYMKIIGDRPPAAPVGEEGIAPGFYVMAPAGKAAPADDPLQATFDLLGEREDVRAMLRQRGEDRPGWEFVPFLMDRHRRWKDPVSARLVERIRGLLADRGDVGGTVPGDWFPPALAKQKSTTTEGSPNP